MERLPGRHPRAAAPIQRPSLFRIYVPQCLLLTTASAVLYLLAGREIAVSALTGGLIAVVPNAYFARQVYRYSGARLATAVVHSFYRGEAGKFLMTVIAFATVFAVAAQAVAPAALFGAYLAMAVINSVCVALAGRRKTGPSGG